MLTKKLKEMRLLWIPTKGLNCLRDICFIHMYQSKVSRTTCIISTSGDKSIVYMFSLKSSDTLSSIYIREAEC